MRKFGVFTSFILIAALIAVITGIAGFIYGKFYLTKAGVNWWLPENLIGKNNFIVVGSIHNFSYIGGILGLLAGIVYLVRKKIQLK